MKSVIKRLLAVCVCAVLLAGLALQIIPHAEAVSVSDTVSQNHYGEYSTLSMVYDQGSCGSMQGMAVDVSYIYSAKINSTDTSAVVMRTDKSTGTTICMTNSATGSYYFDYLGHANDMDTAVINGTTNLFVTAGTTLVRMTISGSTLTLGGTYTATYNGSSSSMTAVKVMSASDDEVKVLIKKGRTLYTGTLDPNASSGSITMTKLCTFNIAEARLKGTTYDFSSYVQQGFGYYDNKIFVPLTGGDSALNTSIILVYDLEGATGDIKNDPTLSFRVISSAYSALFEIESCDICPLTGRLYFNTNRRVSNSDTNHDGIHYSKGYTYNAAMSTTSADDYRWEMQGNVLTSVTDGGSVFNLATLYGGSVTDGVMEDALYHLSRSVVLEHDRPWVVEWKGSGSWSGGALLLATGRTGTVTDAPYLYRYQKSGLIAFGTYDGSQNYNYGIRLSDHGIDGTAEHTYRLTNKIASNGSNMVYLSVDGTELGAMNNYYSGISSQGTTSDWLNGKDFTFSYIGSAYFGLTDCTLEYLQVWADGEPQDAADTYRWETKSDNLTAITGDGLTANTATIYRGSVSDGVYTSAPFRLEEEVVLLHDQPWSIEWQSEGAWTGGAFLLAASDGSKTQSAPFLFRSQDSNIIAFGFHDGTRHNNYGIKLSDHGIDGTASHVYRLTNRIESDGSNMVYLYVDGVELGAMNNYYRGTTAQNTTSDWLNGRDLVFDYIGNSAYPLNSCSLSYLQIWESGAPGTVEFRDWDGTLISSAEYALGETVTVPADPVRADDADYSYTFAGWDKEITLCEGDTVYTATYEATPLSAVITLRYPALSYEDEIFYNIFFQTEHLDAELTDMGLLTWSSEIDGTYDTAEAVIPGVTLESNGLYCARSLGIPAKEMGDTLYFKVYAKLADGTYIYSALRSYSATTYAANILNSSTASTENKALCVAMLNYGAAAQTYFGYQTDALMNASLTEAQKALVTGYSADMLSEVVSASPSKTAAFSAYAGGFSRKYPAIDFGGAFSISYRFTPSNTADGEMTLYIWDSADYGSASRLNTTNATTSLTMTLQSDGSYEGTVAGIAAKDIDETFYVCAVYESGGTAYCTGVLAYSLGAYCKTQAAGTTAMQPFASATAVYAYYAKTYLSSL